MERLKELRKNKEMTQLELAKKLNVVESTISMYESGKREPDIGTLKKIANHFAVTIDYLVGNEVQARNNKETDILNLTPKQQTNIDLLLQLNEMQQSELKGYLLRLLEERGISEEKGIY